MVPICYTIAVLEGKIRRRRRKAKELSSYKEVTKLSMDREGLKRLHRKVHDSLMWRWMMIVPLVPKVWNRVHSVWYNRYVKIQNRQKIAKGVLFVSTMRSPIFTFHRRHLLYYAYSLVTISLYYLYYYDTVTARL